MKICKRIYQKIFGAHILDPKSDLVRTPQGISDIIYEELISPNPCMIARYGSTELNVIVNYLFVKENKRSWIRYIKGESFEWWWNEKGLRFLRDNAGFFPLSEKYVCQFCELMITDTQQLDVLASWQDKEILLIKDLPDLRRTSLVAMEPYWAERPWTRALKGKKVLVIHPFAKLIEKQYREHRTQLFKNPDVLPEFELQTIKAVQSIGGVGGQFSTWFDALRYMEDEIDKRDYDIALIGCGAYGFPLAAHVKRSGKKAVHIGGALQLLFGIKGNRWENPKYGSPSLGGKGKYIALFNEYWCRPGEDVKPANAEKVEGACYW